MAGEILGELTCQSLLQFTMVMLAHLTKRLGRRDDDEPLIVAIDRALVEQFGSVRGKAVFCLLVEVGFAHRAAVRASRARAARLIGLEVAVGRIGLLLGVEHLEVRIFAIALVAEEQHFGTVGDHHHAVVGHAHLVLLVFDTEPTPVRAPGLRGRGAAAIAPAMHDIRAIRDDPEGFDAALERKGLPPHAANLLSLDEARRGAATSAQQAQARRNEASKAIGQAKAKRDEAAAEALMGEVAQLKQSLPVLEEEERTADAALTEALAVLPNLPLADVPDGADESGNVE